MRIRLIRDKFFGGFVKQLTLLNIKPFHISIAGIFSILLFIYFFRFNPWIACVFIVANLFLDGIDGALARYQKNDGVSGAITDVAVDNLCFFLVFMTVFYYGILNYFWGTTYLFLQTVMLFLVLSCNSMKISVFPIVKPKYYFYLFLFMFVFVGWNFFDQLLVGFSVYMAITNVFLFEKIRWSIR